MLKKDSWLLGIALGILTPIVAFAIMYYLNIFISQEIFHKPPIFRELTIKVLAGS